MAFSQIATSTTILSSGLIGYNGISLTNFMTSALSAIAAGSAVEIAGAFFKVSSDETINASSWTAITTANNAYLALTPSGSAGSQIVTAAWTADTPVWVAAKQGWYASAGSVTRITSKVYKEGTSSQSNKRTVSPLGTIVTEKYDMPTWNMGVTTYGGSNSAFVTIPGSISLFPEAQMLAVRAYVMNDSRDYLYPITASNSASTASALGSVSYTTTTNRVTMTAPAGGFFDNINFSTTFYSRGFVVLDLIGLP